MSPEGIQRMLVVLLVLASGAVGLSWWAGGYLQEARAARSRAEYSRLLESKNKLPIAVLSVVGYIEYLPPGETEWRRVKADTVLFEGTRIRVGHGGRLQIQGGDSRKIDGIVLTVVRQRCDGTGEIGVCRRRPRESAAGGVLRGREEPQRLRRGLADVSTRLPRAGDPWSLPVVKDAPVDEAARHPGAGCRLDADSSAVGNDDFVGGRREVLNL